MKQWLSASEIAALELPGLPRTRQGVNDLAERAGWHGQRNRVRQGQGRGAPIEFHADLLPAEARDAYAAKTIARMRLPDDVAAEAAAEPEAAALSARAGEERDARLWIVAACARFVAAAGLGAKVGDERFVRRYNAGAVEAQPWIRRAVPELSARSLARWRSDAKAGRKSKLAVDQSAKRKGKGALETAEGGEVRTFVLGMLCNGPHLSVDHVRENVVKRYPALDKLSSRTFAHQIKIWRARYSNVILQATNPDAYKSKARAVVKGGSHPVSRLNELWMIDASPADVLTTEGRYAIYACIDVYSRRLIVYVTKTARAEAVALLMRRAVLAWGLPERVLTDNGSDFRAHRTVRLMAELAIEVEVSPPFTPEAKPHVERAIGTLQHDLMETLPGYVGHSVADRKVIEERRAFAARLGESDDDVFCVDVTPAELQERCDAWAAGRYAARRHDGIGVSPLERAAEYRGAVRRVKAPALDVLLAPVAGVRTVTKAGIRVANAHYQSGAVEYGDKVLVRLDPEDVGRIRLFAEDGEAYLGDATCPDLRGISPAEFIAEVRAEHERIDAEVKAEVRRARKAYGPRQVADAIAARGAAAAANVVAFPHREVEHTTPALEAAAEAARAERGAVPTIEVRHGGEAFDIGDVPGVAVLAETPAMRFRRAKRLEDDMAAGRGLSATDGLWLSGYRQGAEYMTYAGLYAEFGEEAL